jgi:response regulator RpfG family c-di-GMP phosphodiesterase
LSPCHPVRAEGMEATLADPPAADAGRLTKDDTNGSLAQALFNELRTTSIVLSEDWEALPAAKRDQLAAATDTKQLLAALVEHGLLTEYQAERITTGATFGLVLGNYRVLDRQGDGAVGVVYRAEHVRMRRTVAIKVLSRSLSEDGLSLGRFLGEMRAVARLQHPNIVSAIDAGELIDDDPDRPVLHYFVMEYVAGDDLEQWVEKHGPMTPVQACGLVYQAASALAEAHKHQLVHRDIKPSNMRLTPEGQVKLLDFGLARHFHSRKTEHGLLLGTIDFIAPEQARDASSVDIRADIYGLGGVLFWCLTGTRPFQCSGNVAQSLVARMMQPPPSARHRRSELSPELDALVARMMAVNPEDRFPEPRAVMRALQSFLQAESLETIKSATAPDLNEPGNSEPIEELERVQRVLLVDDEPHLRRICRYALQSEVLECAEAANGVLALEALQMRPYDLVLLDVDMPEMKGTEVLERLRKAPPCPHLKIIMVSGRAAGDEMAEMLLAGADDFLPKPFTTVQLKARVQSALRLKAAQDRSDALNRQLARTNSEQGHTLSARETDLVRTRNALMIALSKLVAYRRGENDHHLVRLPRFCRCLAEDAASMPEFANQIDPLFIQDMERCAPLHDIGTVALPDHILVKPSKLDPAERLVMQSHTTIGAEILEQVGQRHSSALSFLKMAVEIVRHHHERYDGTGYPARLAGDAIPLAARFVAIGDTYDSLRSGRAYRVALNHACTVQAMVEESPGQFDPNLLVAFGRCAPQFDRIYQELPG